MGRLSIYLKSLTSGLSGKPTKLFYSLSNQVLLVGATFLANIALARTSTETEYGTFVLMYSIFTFLSGVHNALIVEPYTVFASGRYRARFPDYLQLILRVSFVVGLVFAVSLFLLAGAVFVLVPDWFSPTMLGLAAGVLFLLTGALFQRTFYVSLDSRSAARMSAFFFTMVCLCLAGLFYAGAITGLSVFLSLALGWIVVSPMFFRKYPVRPGASRFLSDHPDYWRCHWRYSRWVLATALFFLLLNQGYYWIVVGLLTVEDVAKLRAVQNVVLPVNLIFTSISLLILPRMALIFQQHAMDGLIPFTRQMARAMLGTAVGFAVLIWIIGTPVLHLMYAGKYTDSVHLLYILGLTPIALGLGHVFNDALKAMERPRWVFYAYVAGGGVTLFAGVPLVLNFGLVGAVWGIVASSLAYGLMLIGGFFKCSLVSRADAIY